MNRLAEDFSIDEDVEEESGRFQDSFLRMRSPLLPTDDGGGDVNNNNNSELRHRSSASTSAADQDAEEQQHRFQPQQQRILDRSGDYGQSRGRWGVERRLSSPPPSEERRRRQNEDSRCCSLLCYCCCCWKSKYGVGKDWFFWLAYKKTPVLFLLLFVSYAFIIGFFGFIYLSVSIFGSKAEVNPDGSTKIIAFCDMGKCIEFCILYCVHYLWSWQNRLC